MQSSAQIHLLLARIQQLKLELQYLRVGATLPRAHQKPLSIQMWLILLDSHFSQMLRSKPKSIEISLLSSRKSTSRSRPGLQAMVIRRVGLWYQSTHDYSLMSMVTASKMWLGLEIPECSSHCLMGKNLVSQPYGLKTMATVLEAGA